jgi:hypothetical protein
MASEIWILSRSAFALKIALAAVNSHLKASARLQRGELRAPANIEGLNIAARAMFNANVNNPAEGVRTGWHPDGIQISDVIISPMTVCFLKTGLWPVSGLAPIQVCTQGHLHTLTHLHAHGSAQYNLIGPGLY